MIWDWIIGSIPAWVWMALAVAAALVIAAVLRQGGWKWALGALVAGAAAYLQAKSYQRGASTERAKQQHADQKAREVIYDNRDDARMMPDDQLDKEIDKWTKL